MTALLLLACSGSKAKQPAPALELYQGVMYQTLRTNWRAGTPLQIIILSALHGFISPDRLLEPYDQLMTRDRADHMLAALPEFMFGAGWPQLAPSRIFLAGGAEYRRVMHAALTQLGFAAGTEEVTGGIGCQRQQLGHFLRSL